MLLPFPDSFGSVKQVVLLGLGRESWSTYSVLAKYFPELTFLCLDDKKLDEIDEKWSTLVEKDDKISFFCSKSQEINIFLQKIEPKDTLFYKTPGIPPSHPIIDHLSQQGVAFTSNTQLYFQLVTELKKQMDIVTIGVTGTKGKSTTTAFLHHVLTTAQVPCSLGGNIGVPPVDTLLFLENLDQYPDQTWYVCLELSSHQLIDLSVSPDIAIIQNITPEHLDYYPDFESYWHAKRSICAYQGPADVAIFDEEFELPKTIADLGQAQQLTFSINQSPRQNPNLTAGIHEGQLFYGVNMVTETDEIKLPGKHNLYNILPVLVVAERIGVPIEFFIEALASFRGLPHRMEYVCEKNGVTYYNDSLSTTPVATIAALRAVSPASTILIAGGHERNLDFSELANRILNENVKLVLLFSPSGNRIREAVTSTADQHQMVAPIMKDISSMPEAIQVIQQHSESGDVVLLSPGSPSFGLFQDYEDRGNQFKSAIQ